MRPADARWRSLLPAGLIVLIIVAAAAALVREGRLRDRDLARFDALDAATRIASSLAEGAEPADLPAALTGWGLYAPDGTALRTRGTAPGSLASGEIAGAPETVVDGRLRSIRSLSMAGAMPDGAVRGRAGGGPGGGAGMRRLLLVDWDLGAARSSGLRRFLGAAALALLAVLLLVMQQLSEARLARYRRDEERRTRLVQLGLAARTLTHEIRNPLGTIRAQEAVLRKTLPEGHEDELDIIAGEVDRLNGLSDRVREWLDDPAGRPEILDLGETVPGILRRFPANVTLAGEPPSGLRIRMDPMLFETTVTNLLRNAVESHQAAGRTTPPEMVLDVRGRRVSIHVDDAGTGLPEGPVEELFDPFRTTKTRGSGVGLALARRAAEAAGGSLELRDRPEGGARASLVLPLEKS